MEILLVVIGVVALLITIFLLRKRKTYSPVGKPCSICGAPSKFSYSQHAEEALNAMRPMCLNCLVSQLEKDYTAYTRRAVAVQPTPGPPCYVFQPLKEWGDHFPHTKLTDDVKAILSAMKTICYECGKDAHYQWIEAKGFTAKNFSESLQNGFSKILLLNNPRPISLCGKCCAAHIARDLEQKNLSYLEVCGPTGVGDGFVIPMGY